MPLDYRLRGPGSTVSGAVANGLAGGAAVAHARCREPEVSLLTLAIGPVTQNPSWQWLGPPVARELRKYFRIKIFRRELARCDVALTVKVPLAADEEARALDRGTRIIHMPVDRYCSPEEIRSERARLAGYAAVLVHCERLRPHLEAHVPNVWSIDHHNRFGLARPAAYRRTGFVLWVGAIQNAAYLLRWLERHPLPVALKLLTNHTHKGGRAAFERTASQIGLHARWERRTLDSHELVTWSARRQKRLLGEAIAAIDIKGGSEDFNQFTKPPTKAQKYVASGLPFAVNADSYSWEYFAARGLTLATPDDSARWFSEAYWRQTLDESRRLSAELSLDAVGRRLAAYVERVADLRR